MPLSITDTFVDVTGAAQSGYAVTATPNYTPFFQNFSGTWKEVKPGSLSTTTDVNGLWSLSLPFPSVSDPSSTKWIITLPDGTKWLGLVPEGIAGPLTIKTLKDTYSWALAAGAQGTTVTAVAGPQGPAGPGAVTTLTTQTTNYTLLSTDGGVIANAAGLTITLPSAVVMGNGKSFVVKNGGSGTNTIVASTAGTIDGNTTYTGLVAARASAQFLSDGTNWNVY